MVGSVGSGAAGSDSTMVNPPPGVSSAASDPPMPSAKPRDSARPRPRPVRLSVSPWRWNGTKIASFSAAGMPGPKSMTRTSVRPANWLAARIGRRVPAP